MKLTKYLQNPILKPNPDNDWEERCVLNPAVVYDESRNKFVMLYRAAVFCERKTAASCLKFWYVRENTKVF